MDYHIKICSPLGWVIMTGFMVLGPGFVGKIEGVHVDHVFSFFWDVASVDDHLIVDEYSWVWVYFGYVDVGLNFGPFFISDRVAINQVAGGDGWSLTSEQVDTILMCDSCVRFEFDGLSFT